MTTHLPECWATDPSDPPAWCICDELRACEQRVTARAVQRVEAIPAPNRMIDVMPRGEQFVRRSAAIAAIKGDRP